METEITQEVKTDRSGFGITVGVITFLVGVGLLLLTFKLAYDLFTVPPSEFIKNNAKGDTIDIGRSGDSLAVIVIRVLLLIVMGLMGSLIANRGVSLFTNSRTKRHRE